MTEAFTRTLERDIRRVGKFVASQLKLLREAFKAAKTTAAKRSVENDLDKLRASRSASGVQIGAVLRLCPLCRGPAVRVAVESECAHDPMTA